MGIRIAERARISQEFKDTLIMLSVARLKQIRDEMETKTGVQLSCYKRDMGPTIVRLGKLARNPAAALDMIVTRLRGLPYTDFEVVPYPDHPEVLFLAGTTKDIEIRYGHDIYNLGPYSVRVPVSRIIGTAQRVQRLGQYQSTRLPGEDWHFIPLKADRKIHSDYRTPHHYGTWPTSSSTCWGDFNPMVGALTRTADIPELFRTIYIYLSRYDSHSPLHGRLEHGYFSWAMVRRAGAPK